MDPDIGISGGKDLEREAGVGTGSLLESLGSPSSVLSKTDGIRISPGLGEI